MLAAGAVKEMKWYWKGKNERAQQVLHAMRALERGEVVAQSHRDVCTDSDCSPSLPSLLKPSLQLELNPEFVLDLGKRSQGLEMQVGAIQKCGIFQLCNNSIIPLLNKRN